MTFLPKVKLREKAAGNHLSRRVLSTVGGVVQEGHIRHYALHLNY